VGVEVDIDIGLSTRKGIVLSGPIGSPGIVNLSALALERMAKVRRGGTLLEEEVS
jgi:hypothetical protein